MQIKDLLLNEAYHHIYNIQVKNMGHYKEAIESYGNSKKISSIIGYGFIKDDYTFRYLILESVNEEGKSLEINRDDIYFLWRELLYCECTPVEDEQKYIEKFSERINKVNSLYSSNPTIEKMRNNEILHIYRNREYPDLINVGVPIEKKNYGTIYSAIYEVIQVTCEEAKGNKFKGRVVGVPPKLRQKIHIDDFIEYEIKKMGYDMQCVYECE